MFRLIHVPFDGSAFAEQALPLAVSLAQRDGASLQIVRVHEPLSNIYLHRAGTIVAILERELVEYVRSNLDATASRLLQATGFRPDVVHLEGPVAETIVKHASSSGADLMIMTTHGRGTLTRFWCGSVADSLARLSPIPILFVRPQEQAPEFSPMSPFQHVLISLDGSQLAEQALEPGLTLGNSEKGEYSLLRVVPAMLPTDYVPSGGHMGGIHTVWREQLLELQRQQEADAYDYLEQLAKPLRERSLIVHTHVIRHEQPATAILDAASRFGANAIALSTRGQGGLKRLLLGSVADKVVRGSTMPVLICPPVDK